MFDGNSTDAGFTNLDGDDIATFRDIDGSVTGKIAQVVKPMPFHLTAACDGVSNWKMAVCPYEYGQVNWQRRLLENAKKM